MRYELTVFGQPVGKGRPRFTRLGHAYTPEKTKEYENLVRGTFISSYPKAIPLEDAVKMKITAYFKAPDSYSLKKRSDLIGKYYTKKSDVDNIAKIIMDSLNGFAYYDDKQVAKLEVVKKYANESYVQVEMEEANE